MQSALLSYMNFFLAVLFCKVVVVAKWVVGWGKVCCVLNVVMHGHAGFMYIYSTLHWHEVLFVLFDGLVGRAVDLFVLR